VIRGHLLVAHNADFDARVIAQSSRLHRAEAPERGLWECTLDLLTAVNDGRWRWPAPGHRGHRGGRPHRAVYDAESSRRIVLALAGEPVGADASSTE